MSMQLSLAWNSWFSSWSSLNSLFKTIHSSLGCVFPTFVLSLVLFHLPILICCQLEFMCIPLLNLHINATSLGYLYQNYLKATWCKLDRKYIPPPKGLGVEGWSPGQYLEGGGCDCFRRAKGPLWWHYWEVMRSRRWGLIVDHSLWMRLWRIHLALSSSSPVLPRYSRGSSFLPQHPESLCMGPEAAEPSAHGLKPPETWVATDLLFCHAVYLGFLVTLTKT